MKLLEDNRYHRARHFDAHAYRQIDYEDVKEFARGSMRTYMILKENAQQWNSNRKIQALLEEINVQDAPLSKLTKKFSPADAKKLLSAPLDRIELAKTRLPYEKLDQLTMEILMGGCRGADRSQMRHNLNRASQGKAPMNGEAIQRNCP